MGEKGMWVGGDTLLATGPVNPIRAGRERPPLRCQVLHRHGAHCVGAKAGGQGGCKGLPRRLLLPTGLESPSHALRADADPWASSATTTCVTLAEPHRYDRDLEIILYPCGEGGRCPWWVWGRWGVAPKASRASPSPLRHGVAPNPAVPPRAPPPPPGDGGRHHDVPRVRGPRPEPPGLHADRQEGRQWRETGDRAWPPPAQRGGGGRGEVVGCG